MNDSILTHKKITTAWSVPERKKELIICFQPYLMRYPLQTIALERRDNISPMQGSELGEASGR
jgi:hypothetical protein